MTKEEYLQSLDTTDYISIPAGEYARLKAAEQELQALKEARHD